MNTVTYKLFIANPHESSTRYIVYLSFRDEETPVGNSRDCILTQNYPNYDFYIIV